MAKITGVAIIRIGLNSVVRAIHPALGMLVTVQTTEYPIILRIGMADGTTIPDTLVPAGKYWEKRIML
jgi:hypothetical protein